MQFLSLTVKNYGVFSGSHVFDLANSASRPGSGVVVFRGHNGAGKSTLFSAFGLALHGSLSLGDRTSVADYNRFLLGRLNRNRSEAHGRGTVATEGQLRLSLEYVRSGESVNMVVVRTWARTGRTVSERLDVLIDGVPPSGVLRDDYQHFLNDLLPPGLVPLSFFDAEQLGKPAVGTSGQDGLQTTSPFVRDALRRLIGLDTVERLQADVELYLARFGGSLGKSDKHKEAVLSAQHRVDDYRRTLEAVENTAKQLREDELRLEAETAARERRLVAEGGNFAARRPETQARLAQLDSSINDLNHKIEELCSADLPFSLAPDLCRRLSDRLAREAYEEREEIAGELWRNRRDQLAKLVNSGAIFEGINIEEAAKNLLAERFDVLLYGKDGGASESEKRRVSLHKTSDSEREQLQKWIAGALHTVPAVSEALLQALETAHADRAQVQADLDSTPNEELVAPLHATLVEAQGKLNDKRRQIKSLGEKVNIAKYQLELSERERRKAAEAAEKSLADAYRNNLAVRSRAVLRSYRDALLEQQMAELEKAFIGRFNALCLKQHLLEDAVLDPETLSLRLRSVDGQIVDVQSFSAGEQQLCQLALLQALRDISGRDMPLGVDTPLARLDGVHRQRFLESYVRQMGKQVFLFGTDVELDDNALDLLGPSLARVYNVRFDHMKQASSATSAEGLPLTFAEYKG